MEQWQEAASQQLELLTSRLNEALSKGLVWLRYEFGLDLGLKPELIPPWVILCVACTGVLLLVVLWASVCRAVFKKRVVVSTSDDSVDGKRVTSKAAKSEEPKKKKKKAEKKAQPNGRANAESQEEAIMSEELVPHHHLPQEVKTDKAAETKKSKKKAKQAVKETRTVVGDGKEPEEGTWETKVSNKEKREQRKKDKSSSDGSTSPGGGNSPVSTPPAQPKASTASPAPASQKKKKGESAHVKAEKLEAVSAANSKKAAEVAAAATGMSVKVAPKTNSWSTQRQPAPLLRTGIDDSWTLISSSDLVLGPLPRRGVGSAPPQPVEELPWLGQTRADDEWSGLNGGSADPSSDWDAPSEAWGNYEEPSPEPPLPQLAMVNLMGATEDDEDEKGKEDGATDGAAKSKKKKKKKSAEEEGTAVQVQETMKETPLAASGKKQPPAQENAAAVQPVRAAAVEARGQRQVKDTISQKPPVTQVPPKPTDGEPTAKQNNFPAPTAQKKPEENQASKPAKKKKARRET